MNATLNAWSPGALAALRIITGLLFLAHGLVKLFGAWSLDGRRGA